MPDTISTIPTPVVPPAFQTGLCLPAHMPAEIANAVNTIMAQVRSLPKSEHNDHAGYNFASIDAFLAAVGPLCANAGLLVVQDEEGMELLDRAGKTWLRITYAFTLAHSSGVLWDRPMRRTVFQRIDGPQTTGGTQSYALKQFLRSLFQIPTGERDDSDFQPKEDMPARAPVQPPRPSPPVGHLEMTLDQDGKPRSGVWVKGAISHLTSVTDATQRKAWLTEHANELTTVRAGHPDYAEGVEFAAETGKHPVPKKAVAPAPEPPTGEQRAAIRAK